MGVPIDQPPPPFVPGINKGNGLFSQDARWPRVDLPLDTRTLTPVPGGRKDAFLRDKLVKSGR